jgi:hypothetical protein
MAKKKQREHEEALRKQEYMQLEQLKRQESQDLENIQMEQWRKERQERLNE